jgi:PAS domain-containing protein
MILQPLTKVDFSLFSIVDWSTCQAKALLCALEKAGLGVAYWDFEYQDIYWSKGLAEFYQPLVEQPCSYQAYLRQVHPDDRSDLKDLIKRVQTQADEDQIDYRVIIDDQERWLRSCFTPVIQNGKLTHLIELVADISDLKAAQQALIDSETRWRNRLKSVSDVLIETTTTGEIIFATDSITPLWGYLLDELRGLNLLSIVEFETLPTDLMTISSNSAPISVLANVLHQRQIWKPVECNIQIDPDRQTLFFTFKSYPFVETGINSHLQLQAAIATLTQVLSDHYPLPIIFATVSKLLASLLRADCVHVYQYHSDQLLWQNVHEYRQHPDIPCASGFEFPDRDHCIANLLRQLQPLRIDSWNCLGADVEPEFMTNFFGVWMVLPILINASIWGSILIIRCDEDIQWTDQEFTQAIMFGDYINLAIAAQSS